MSKFKIAIVHTIFPGLEIERRKVENAGGKLVIAKSQSEEDMIEVAKDADAVVTTYAEVTRRVIEATEKCKIIVRTGIGVNNIDIPAATEKGIYVANVPDYCFDEVSDHTVSLAIALSRQLNAFDRKVKNRDWNLEGVRPILAMRGQKFGLVGFGNIPKEVAKKVKVFGFKVLAYDPYIDPRVAEDLGVELVSMETLLRDSDFLSLHSPLTNETKHVINEDSLKKMKPTSYLINTSRGPLIDEKALYKALKEGWIAGAGLDVMEQEPPSDDNPLLTLDNIIITPHTAFASDKSNILLREKAIEEAIRGARGDQPRHWVNKNGMVDQQG